jgi:hypothetical protein
MNAESFRSGTPSSASVCLTFRKHGGQRSLFSGVHVAPGYAAIDIIRAYMEGNQTLDV